MEKPLVSYVLTAYNIEKFIEESVKCAFNQTYQNLEIVLSDDCSTDKTFDIMKKMADEYKGPHKIVLNRNEKNMGISQHMSKCYTELASGEIIIAAHGDDISLPNRTSETVKYFLENPKAMQVSCSAVVVDNNLNELPNYYQNDTHVSELRFFDFEHFGHVSIGFSGFRKKVMTKFGYLNDDCPTEDDLIGFRALIMGQVLFAPEKLVYYRKHEGSNSNPQFFDRFPLEKILKQQNDDMEKAVEFGLITKEQKEAKYNELYKGMVIRKRYRHYFADRNILNLIKLIKPSDISFRTKLSYIKQHILYKINRRQI